MEVLNRYGIALCKTLTYALSMSIDHPYNMLEAMQKELLSVVNRLDPGKYPGTFKALEYVLNIINDYLFNWI